MTDLPDNRNKKTTAKEILGESREAIKQIAADHRDDIAPFEQVGKPLSRALVQIAKGWKS